MSNPALKADIPTPPRELDALTLRRARRGDERACRALVRCYEARVFALISRILGPKGLEDQIEDVAQDCFLRIFENLERFDPRGPARLSTWILTLTTRRCVDVLRRPRRHIPVAEVPERALPPTERLIGEGLREAIGALPPEQHAAFVLSVCHGWSHAEIAAALEVETGTVKSRLHRARTRLRTWLGGWTDA